FKVGQTVQFHIRDHDSATQELDQLLSRMNRDQSGKATLLFTCNGRGLHTFPDPDHDAGKIQEYFPGPSAGFFAAGEIGPVAGKNFLHGFTASILIFD
ncbi:MAG: FIST C-terminal domain-containing protein, partial [Planctomycetota bacterium]